jgi:flagellar biosynthesis chaperone FliJ
MRQIRRLENELDKTMIKYNEALSLKKTYETILGKLSEERGGYESQLTAIEGSLKNKTYDL